MTSESAATGLTETRLTATYRLQLGPELGFDDVTELVDRLNRLGISHLYLSPILQAAPGSTHGYDTVDHRRISEALGGRGAFERLVTAAQEAGMGIVVDIVPNHMSIAVPSANRWWWDVLEHGPASRFADHFDITWESSEARQVDTVLLPILGDHYGVVLEAGEIVVERSPSAETATSGFVIRHFDHVLPLSPQSMTTLRSMQGAPADPDGDRLAALNADPDALHEILEQQHYQLAHWRRAQRDLDYRRFFDIDTLIGLRMEDPAVFDATHALVVDLVRSGQVDGLRIDHPDGLTDPAGYLEHLGVATGGTWTVVEKILEPGEALPDWPVAGTTGYDALHVIDGVFRPDAGVARATEWWRNHVDPTPWADVVAGAKAEILGSVLAADVARLADVGLRLCEAHRRHRDHTRHDVTHAIRAVVASMPVYRTYVRRGEAATGHDLDVVAVSVAAARTRAPDVDDDLFGFLESILVGSPDADDLAVEFVQRFQQLTSPAMAKSVEDTAFYRHLPVPAANEVGGDPGAPVVTLAQFHEHNRRIQRDWPSTMTALSTHDTKRSADVRARLDALLGIPDQWIEFLTRWSHWCDEAWTVEPDPRTTTLLLQTVVGAWPIDAARLHRYLEKATKEAKQRTTWTDPDPEFDDAVRRLVDDLLADADFVAAVDAIVRDVLAPGRHLACARQLLQLTVPGIPDCYQGAELWDLSLVDPDNRRPVDHALRQRVAARLEAAGGPTVAIVDDADGEHMLWITRQALRLRRRRPSSFGPEGAYRAVDAGPDAVAYARGDDVVVAATRRTIGDHAPTIDLLDGEWTDLLTGAVHRHAAPVESMILLERTAS